ncbi:MAG TPA: hypothetical protein VGN17_19825 [Bryobacteraceae bacterium]|jgi:hypothetical protein
MAEIINESYGVADAQRERRRKRTFFLVVAVLIVAAIAYFSLRTRGQERVMAQFLQTLQEKRYQDAFQMWGPYNKHYPPESFLEDFGPSSKYPDAAKFKVENVDYCGDGVVFLITYPQQESVGLLVDRASGTITFTPSDWEGRCPGRHLQLGAFFHRIFSSGSSH